MKNLFIFLKKYFENKSLLTSMYRDMYALYDNSDVNSEAFMVLFFGSPAVVAIEDKLEDGVMSLVDDIELRLLDKHVARTKRLYL